MATAATTLAFTGPGSFALGPALALNFEGWGWGPVAFAVGVLAGVALLGMRRTEEIEAEEAEAEETEERHAA